MWTGNYLPCQHLLAKCLCLLLQENHFFLAVGEVGSAASDVQQSVEYVKDHDKEEFLLHWLDNEFSTNPKSLILVFVETKRQCDKLEYILCESGVKAASIHGDRDQGERESALHAFRAGHRPVLVATSVASRGALCFRALSLLLPFSTNHCAQVWTSRM